MLAYYRPQHDNQSWLSTLTTILDTCALLLVAVKDHPSYQAQLTFAMARHAAGDLALIFKTPPIVPDPERFPDSQLQQVQTLLRAAGVPLHDGHVVTAKLAELRAMYEPFVNALAQRLLFSLPPFAVEKPSADNWQRSAWMKRAPDLESLCVVLPDEEHFN
jgi:hypothetical protein